MALKALTIVQEEIARAKENTPYARHALLDALRETITERIMEECVEQPEIKCLWCEQPEGSHIVGCCPKICRFCGKLEEDCLTAAVRDDHIFAPGGTLAPTDIPNVAAVFHDDDGEPFF